MIKLVQRAQLNLHSKYTLEKLKLKKILQSMHSEINKSGLRLDLKGGLETLNMLVAGEKQPDSESRVIEHSNPVIDVDDVRRSVSMSQLL